MSLTNGDSNVENSSYVLGSELEGLDLMKRLFELRNLQRGVSLHSYLRLLSLAVDEFIILSYSFYPQL